MTAAKKAATVEATAPAAPVRNPWTLATPAGEPAPRVDRAPAPPAEHGFRGQQADQTPDEFYTVAGQLAAMPVKG